MVRASRLPGGGAGRGVFARHALRAGAVVTEYSGVLVPPGKLVSRGVAAWDFALEVPPAHAPDGRQGWTLVGDTHPAGRQGVGQLANDALHPAATGRANNCEFCWEGGRCFLRALRRVPAGKELFVSYHTSYWVRDPGGRRSAGLGKRARAWIRVAKALDARLEAHGLEVEEWATAASTGAWGDRCCEFRVRVAPRCTRPPAPVAPPPACGCPGQHWGARKRRVMWVDVRCFDGGAHFQWRCAECAVCTFYFAL